MASILKDISSFLSYRFGNVKAFIVLLVLTTVSVTVVFRILADIDKSAGSPVEILDMRFHWTLDDAFTLFDKIGKDGRSLYRSLYVQGYDVISPLIMDLGASSLFSMVYPGSLLNLLPFVRFFCDMAENVCVLILMNNYPVREGMELTAQIGTIFGTGKFLVIFSGAIILLIGTIKSCFGTSNKSKKSQ